ncbi:MAG: FHA domain-containing protein [Planctomycetes bacterium]|nr:FHA domain-containing protein [Planctomycetota bacterium]
MLLMHIIEGGDRGKKFELPAHEPQLIGRSTEALPFTDDTISRRHAELTPDQGKWFINDLDSANGTYVNGRMIVDRTELKPGDRIRCGTMVAVLEQIGENRSLSRMSLLDEDATDISILSTVDQSSEGTFLNAIDPLAAAIDHLNMIYRLIALTGPTFQREELLQKVMDLCLEEFQPDRGLILLGSEIDQLEPVVVKRPSTDIHTEEDVIPASRVVLAHALEKGEGVLAKAARSDPRYASGAGQDFSVYSVLCVPIRTGERIYGAIYIESSKVDFTYTEAQLQLMNVFGQHTGLALLNAELLTSKVHNERLATVGQTVASLSHSIKNILQSLRGGADAVELALNRNNLDMAKEGWPILNRNLDRIFALTLNMLAYSKPQTLDIELISLHQVIEEVTELIQPQCARKRVKLNLELADDMPPIPADAGAMHQALMNLLFNAIEAVSAKRGIITVRTRYLTPTREAEIAVIDNGPGIDPTLRKQIFEAFSSTKGQRGTGLGLAVTRKIIHDHHGTIRLETQLGHGASFILTLPTDRDGLDPDDTRQPSPLPHVEIHQDL